MKTVNYIGLYETFYIQYKIDTRNPINKNKFFKLVDEIFGNHPYVIHNAFTNSENIEYRLW